MLPADHSFVTGIVKNLRHDPGDALSKAVSLRKIESEPKNCIMSVLFCLRITHYLMMTLIRDVSYGKDKQRHHADFG